MVVPDTGERGVSVSELQSSRDCELREPMFLHGYAWEKNSEGIIGYGDLNTEKSWIYLEEDLTPCHGFVLQLVPDMVDDVFLHGRITTNHSFEIDGQTYVNCVECFYAVGMENVA